MNRGSDKSQRGVSPISFRSLAMLRVFLLVLIGIFCAAIIYALVVGNFWKEGALLVSIPWGVVALVDLYMGFLLFSLFVFATEPRIARACLWVLFLMLFGNMIAALYVYGWVSKRESGQC